MDNPDTLSMDIDLNEGSIITLFVPDDSDDISLSVTSEEGPIGEINGVPIGKIVAENVNGSVNIPSLGSIPIPTAEQLRKMQDNYLVKPDENP